MSGETVLPMLSDSWRTHPAGYTDIVGLIEMPRASTYFGTGTERRDNPVG